MIKTLVVSTREIDDAEAAIKEIEEQIEAQGGLKSNSVGIVACHYEFIFAGSIKAICQALPFDVAGAISVVQAVNGDADAVLLTIMILTSDDAKFVAKLTSSLSEGAHDPIEKVYNEALADGAGKPALALVYTPVKLSISGDRYAHIFDQISEGVPFFGTMAIDDTGVLEHAFTIFNGEHYEDCAAMILIFADINPQFFLATISDDKILPTSASVTKSDGQVLMGINGDTVNKYFENLGLSDTENNHFSLASLPFMLDYGDGTPPVSRVFIARTPDGYSICAGEVPEGTTIRIGVFDRDDVVDTTTEAMKEAISVSEGASAALMYSCISRSMSLANDIMAEIDMANKIIGDKLPFMLSDSGGEFCPTCHGDEETVNRFHNNTFIICIF